MTRPKNIGSSWRSWPKQQSFAQELRSLAERSTRLKHHHTNFIVDLTAGDGTVSISNLTRRPSSRQICNAVMKSHMPAEGVLIEMKRAAYAKLLDAIHEETHWIPRPRGRDQTIFSAGDKRIIAIRGNAANVDLQEFTINYDLYNAVVIDDPNSTNSLALTRDILTSLQSAYSLRIHSVIGVNAHGSSGSPNSAPNLSRYSLMLAEYLSPLVPVTVATVGDEHRWLYIRFAERDEVKQVIDQFKYAFRFYQHLCNTHTRGTRTIDVAILTEWPALGAMIDMWEPSTAIWPEDEWPPPWFWPTPKGPVPAWVLAHYQNHPRKKVLYWATDHVEQHTVRYLPPIKEDT